MMPGVCYVQKRPAWPLVLQGSRAGEDELPLSPCLRLFAFVVQRVAVGVLQITFLRKPFYYCSAFISTRARRAGDTAPDTMPTAGC